MQQLVVPSKESWSIFHLPETLNDVSVNITNSVPVEDESTCGYVAGMFS